MRLGSRLMKLRSGISRSRRRRLIAVVAAIAFMAVAYTAALVARNKVDSEGTDPQCTVGTAWAEEHRVDQAECADLVERRGLPPGEYVTTPVDAESPAN
jgi:hypothetical protein